MSLTRRNLLTVPFRGVPSSARTESNRKRSGDRRQAGEKTPLQSPTSEEAWDEFLNSGNSRFSSDKTELLVRHFFRDRRDGFFVDVGCYLPEKNSSTCFLEHHLGWRGIALDAQDRLESDWVKLRRRSKFIHAVLAGRSGEDVVFYRAAGFSSLILEKIREWERENGVDLDVEELNVVTAELGDVLRREKVRTMDFLSIHLNGSELRVLKNFDLQKYRPSLVRVQAQRGRRKPLRELFERSGYRLIEEYRPYDGLNRYFTPAGKSAGPSPTRNDEE